MKPQTEIGIVTGCLSLNVRKEPRMSSEIICLLDSLTEVLIDEKGSTDEFYKVTTASGIDGFCMKKYISIRQ